MARKITHRQDFEGMHIDCEWCPTTIRLELLGPSDRDANEEPVEPLRITFEALGEYHDVQLDAAEIRRWLADPTPYVPRGPLF